MPCCRHSRNTAMEFLKTCRLPATKTPSMSDSAIEIGSQQYAPVCAPSGPACGRDGSLGHNPNPELLEELAVRIRGWQRRVIDVAPFTGLVRTGGWRSDYRRRRDRKSTRLNSSHLGI